MRRKGGFEEQVIGWASGKDSSSGCAREPYPQASSGRVGERKEGMGNAVADECGGGGSWGSERLSLWRRWSE
ncbi:expressed unknown protein [Ectocarpus siliculosus]|uniref:Uncharacterized protein n=1 Tax=Ectocarpus siliculosus TaxID=2880 RepID=D8LLU6_ECTSI|nr:expressed unknown protein [Ectocarpus siliculosus]|eukprot:CBN76182.1 expressed unknown protein [Ectocarpus siliculosus]